MVFLKAVKTGQAGPPFGAAVAAAGVVVIDFVSNWLLKRLRGPAGKVAGKIKEIAKKIGNKIKKAVKKLGKKFGKLKDKLFGKKNKKRDKDKANKSADRAKLKKAADKAAKAGWNKARKASSKEVISSGKLESILNQAGNSKGKGIHVVGSRGSIISRPSQLDLYVRLSPHTAPDVLKLSVCSCECSRDSFRGRLKGCFRPSFHGCHLHDGGVPFRH